MIAVFLLVVTEGQLEVPVAQKVFDVLGIEHEETRFVLKGGGNAFLRDAVKYNNAARHASAQSSGLVETLGSMSKSIGVGNAARNGLVSALLAQRDFFGPDQPLEGARGFLRVTGENPDFACITQGLGAHWEILSNAYKPYPCGVVLNPVIEACLALSKNPELFIS